MGTCLTERFPVWLKKTFLPSNTTTYGIGVEVVTESKHIYALYGMTSRLEKLLTQMRKRQ